MKLGTIQAAPGSKAYGRLQTGATHGQFPAQIPLHIVNGAQAGPTLVVQAGTSGLEIEPALVLPHIVKELQPAQVSGALILVPLMNTSGFEFTQVNSAWDDKHLNRLGRGKARGSISQQMVHQYYQAAIADADALLDIRSGSQWSYHHFAGVYNLGNAKKSRDLAVALGLPQVVLGREADESMASEAAKDGLAVVAAHIGGGPGLRDYRERDLGRIRNAVLNAMRHLGMLAGKLESDSENVVVLQQHTVLKPTRARGFTFIDKSLRGKAVQAGDQLGYVRHPFSGEVLEAIRAPRSGIVVEGGAAWPVVPEDTVLAMLGDLVEEVAFG